MDNVQAPKMKYGKSRIGELTSQIRGQIERQARIGGGISRSQTYILLDHIDRISELLDMALELGESWTEEEWSTFVQACLPLLDGWPVRTSWRLRKKSIING